MTYPCIEHNIKYNKSILHLNACKDIMEQQLPSVLRELKFNNVLSIFINITIYINII